MLVKKGVLAVGFNPDVFLESVFVVWPVWVVCFATFNVARTVVVGEDTGCTVGAPGESLGDVVAIHPGVFRKDVRDVSSVGVCR